MEEARKGRRASEREMYGGEEEGKQQKKVVDGRGRKMWMRREG